MEAKPKLYLIPGLGADARLFAGLKQAGLDFEVLEFIPPLAGESMQAYARRLAKGIDPTQPFIIVGVSLGGIMSVEVARHLQPEKVILISSVKSSRELPFYFKLLRFLPLHKPFSGHFYKKYAPRDRRKGMPEWKYQLLEDMRTDADPTFVKWAVNAVVHWRNRETPPNVIHLHGSRDLMFPPLFLGPRTTIPGGRHVMVLAKSEQVMLELQKYV